MKAEPDHYISNDEIAKLANVTSWFPTDLSIEILKHDIDKHRANVFYTCAKDSRNLRLRIISALNNSILPPFRRITSPTYELGRKMFPVEPMKLPACLLFYQDFEIED